MASHDGQNDRVDCDYSLMSSDRTINYGHFQDFVLSLVPEEREILRAFGNDRGTEDVNLTLGIEDLDPVIPVKGIEAIGILEWGTGDTRQVAEIDWKEGANLAVPCSIIQLRASVAALGVFPVGASVRLKANIAWGAGSSTHVTRTLRVTVPAGGTATFRIPKFAAKFFPLPQDPAAAAGIWTMLSGPGGDIVNFGTVAAAQFPGVEIPGIAKFATLTAAAGAGLSALFLLSL
jgi:hypothetical protein